MTKPTEHVFFFHLAKNGLFGNHPYYKLEILKGAAQTLPNLVIGTPNRDDRTPKSFV